MWTVDNAVISTVIEDAADVFDAELFCVRRKDVSHEINLQLILHSVQERFLASRQGKKTGESPLARMKSIPEFSLPVLKCRT